MNNEADIQVVDSTPDVENEQMHLIAKLAAGLLSTHYKQHLWMVGWMPGRALVIKNMAIDDGKYGFTVDCLKAATISEIEKAVIYGGGELLERCGAPRGAWDGEFLTLKHKD